MNKIISIEGLSKSFGDIKAVNNIAFDVEEGRLLGFLGVNGAGKSTTINILCSILAKDSGKIIIAGYDLDKEPNKIKREVGIVFQNSVLDKRLSVKDNLMTRASYYGIHGKEFNKRLGELNDLLGLEELYKRSYGKLSGGQRRRVDIARGLLNQPKILFLDEPTTGLDPSTRVRVWEVIDTLRKNNNMTVFLTTHYMEESNRADKVIIMDSGNIVAEGTPHELKNIYSGTYAKCYTGPSDALSVYLDEKGYKYEYTGECYKILLPKDVMPKDFVEDNGIIMNDFEIIKGDMDDVFLNVTGKILKEA